MFANRKYKELSYPQKSENVRPHKLKQQIRSYTPVVPSKTIPDSRPKWAKYITVFRPKRRIYLFL